MSKKKQKEKFIDTGVTVADMNVKGMPWYKSKKETKARRNMVGVTLLPHERRAIIFGAFSAYLPVFLSLLTGFAVIYILFLLWANNV
jgi:hypothetical protein